MDVEEVLSPHVVRGEHPKVDFVEPAERARGQPESARGSVSYHVHHRRRLIQLVYSQGRRNEGDEPDRGPLGVRDASARQRLLQQRAFSIPPLRSCAPELHTRHSPATPPPLDLRRARAILRRRLGPPARRPR